MQQPVNPQRRRTLQALSIGSLALWGGQTWAQSRTDYPSCVLTPEQSTGPFFVDERLRRADIRTDPATGQMRPGLPFSLQLTVQAVDGASCAPLQNAVVDLWHCDAQGLYSGVNARNGDTRQQAFLRGFQLSDAQGQVNFTTIYPGWYPGRAVHMHIRVRPAGERSRVFATQLYFPDTFSAAIYKQAPYNAHRGVFTPNSQDFLYRRGGEQLTVTPQRGQTGYQARYALGIALG